MIIPRCFDSHVHFLGTGEIQAIWNLSSLQSATDILSIPAPTEASYRQEWIVGFGWDQHRFTDPSLISRQLLDQRFPDNPVHLIRSDGHMSWVNTKALQRAGMPIDASTASGVLLEQAKLHLEKSIPPWSENQRKDFFKSAQDTFLQAGFTHIRDMTWAVEDIETLLQLEQSKDLLVYVEGYLWLHSLPQLENLMKQGIAANLPSKRIRLKGLKVFYDGALGSGGALLSRCYCGSHNKGLALWTIPQLKEVMAKCWSQGLEVAVHAIGDEAVHQVVLAAKEVQHENELRPLLAIEHAELVRPETMSLMKNLSVKVHQQPSHFLSDRLWLKKKLGDLYDFVFPWEALANQGIDLHWGSDSPIEPPSLARTYQALQESAQAGIPTYSREWWRPHIHPDSQWGPGCRTVFENSLVQEVWIDEERVIKNR